MEIYFEKTNKTKHLQIENPKKLKEILAEEGISLESVILVKNNEVCLEDEMISNDDKIKILSVVSGG